MGAQTLYAKSLVDLLLGLGQLGERTFQVVRHLKESGFHCALKLSTPRVQLLELAALSHVFYFIVCSKHKFSLCQSQV